MRFRTPPRCGIFASALELIEPFFHRFGDYLDTEGDQAKREQIVDTSIEPAPIQRNSREEHQCNKKGEVPDDWSDAKR
jgi:IS5 family transposase